MQHSTPKKIVLIGSSTGGPSQLFELVASLSQFHKSSIIIAQHMLDGFMESFTQTLSQKSIQNRVVLTCDTMPFVSNTVYVCEGETILTESLGRYYFSVQPAKKDGYNPSINTIFHSFLPLTKRSEILSVILTGIGADGVEACVALQKEQVRCITETSQSAIVDGMPAKARSLVPNVEVFTMQEIVEKICEFCE